MLGLSSLGASLLHSIPWPQADSLESYFGPNTQEASEQDKFLAYCLSQLKYRVVKAPPFWITDTSMVQGNLPDINLISLALDRAISAELLYKEQLKVRREESLKKATEAAKAIQEGLIIKPKEEKE